MTILERAGDGSRVPTWSGGAKSTAFRAEGGSVYSLSLPSTFTCTEATFEVEKEDGTFEAVHYRGAPLATDVTPGARNILPVELFACSSSRMKIVLDTNETGEGRFYAVK